VRYLAWLNAVPEKQSQSRLQKYKETDSEIEMPPLSASYLVAYLFDIGPTFPSAMGGVGLPYSEIESWQRQSGIDLQPWEVKALRMASIQYASQSHLSTKIECSPPWLGEAYKENVGAKVSRIFKSLVKK
jgi:hypothetical protein